ncbi:hypothetical protein SRRS_43060 [Sporomusa rhizae]|uniref:methyl-accepting chemotaxis protein n=1 Tax=Sporomusa rhizae TaxID=357999 RepID=UPI00352B23D5
MKLKMGAKVGLSFGIIIVLIAINVGFAWSVLSSIVNNAETVEKASNQLSLGNKIAYQYHETVIAIRTYVAFGDPKVAARIEEELNATLQLEDELLNIAPQAAKPSLEQLRANTKKYSDSIRTDYMPIAIAYQRETAAGNLVQAQEYKTKLNEVAKVVVPLSVEIDKTLKAVAEENDKLVAANLQETNRLAHGAKSLQLVIGIAALLLGIAISVVLTIMIKRPLGKLAAVTDNYAQGDLREIVQVNTSDELGELAHSLKIMRDSLSDIVINIAQSSQQVAAASEELTANAEQSSQAAIQVATIVTEIALGANNQVTATKETSTIVEKMSTDIKDIAANAVNVAGVADKAAEAANSGGKSVATAVAQMNNIERTVNDSSTVVSKLGERSKEIGQIVDTISGLAGQTNLLALNAAIEAARAGEQGRGFAVVAEEVRKLAEQSQSAAKQISDLIFEIQGDTEKAVTSMTEGTKEVKAGTQVVNATGESFRIITDLVTEVSSQIREISASIGEMAASSIQIVTSVRDIEEVCKSTAGQTQNVSAAAEEQSASMEEIAASSQSLAKLAEELQESMCRFRL